MNSVPFLLIDEPIESRSRDEAMSTNPFGREAPRPLTQFALNFSVENVAFEQAEELETVRILRETADKIERGQLRGKVLDANGNTVGQFSLA